MSEQNIVAQKISTANADSYKWGGLKADQCDGWHLVRTPQLSIIEESMLLGTSERRDYHRYARQFFYVLDGELAIEDVGASFLSVFDLFDHRYAVHT
jgi:hypothetical protein